MPGFRLFMLGMFGQMAAMSMQMVNRTLLVYRITGSVEDIGIMGLAGTLPHIFASLYGGVFADRVEKKFVLMFALGGFFLLAAFTAVALATGLLNAGTWWLLIISSVIESALMGILVPARMSIMPALVGKERLMNALSLNSLAQNGWVLIAPIGAGFIVQVFSFSAAYYVMAGLYLWAFIFMIFLPRTGNKNEVETSALTEVKEGFKYVSRTPEIAWVLGLNFFAVVLAMPFQQLLPVFVDNILHVGASGLGILISVSGAGAIVASSVLASLPDKKRGLMLIFGTMFWGLMLVAFSFSTAWAVSLGVMILIGIGQASRMTLSSTLSQYYSDHEYHGRIMGIQDMQMSFPGLAVFGASLLTGVIGISWTVASFGLALAAISLGIFSISPRLRHMD